MQLVTFAGGVFEIPDPGEVGWGEAVTDYLVALSQAATQSQFVFNVRTTTVASSSFNATDTSILVNVGSASTVALPTGLAGVGRFAVVGDASGNASSNPITVNPGGGQTIDGGLSSYVISADKGFVFLQFDGVSDWKVVAEKQDTRRNNATNASMVGIGLTARSAYASSTNNQVATVTLAGSSMFRLRIQLNTGDALEVCGNVASASLSATCDPSGLFLPSNPAGTTGTLGIVVTKSAASSVISIRNRLGATRTIGVLCDNLVTAATAWA